MNGLNVARTSLMCSSLLVFCSKVMALPFTIAPSSNVVFPTNINSGQPLSAIYTVTNNTSINLSAIHLQNLPPNVSQVTTDPLYPSLWSSSFSLAAGASCTLELAITDSVNNLQSFNNASLCISGTTKTCQGFALNFPASGWSLIGGAHVNSIDLFIELLNSNSSVLYAAGHSSDNLSALGAYVNGTWTKIFQDDGTITGNGSVFQGMSFINSTLGYLSGHNNSYGTVYTVNTGTNPATVANLNFKNYTQTIDGQTEYPYEVDALLYDGNNQTLYIGGEATIDHINNYGIVYSYHQGTFTNLGLDNTLFVDSLAIAGSNLYVAAVGSGVNFAEVFSYPLAGGSWSDTYLPSSIDEVNSLVADSQGNLYAGGFDDNGGTVWKYASGVWTSLNFQLGADIKSLIIDNNDVLYAAGINNNYGGGVWSYSNGNWKEISPGSSSFVNSITSMSGILFAAGQSPISEQCVWQK